MTDNSQPGALASKELGLHSRQYILRICTAYESGFGRGRSKRDLAQPYADGCDEAEAYLLGWQRGSSTAETPDGAAVEDRAYYNGARAAAAMAHQSLAVMDKWINSGCGNRVPAVKAAACTGCNSTPCVCRELADAQLSDAGPWRLNNGAYFCRICGNIQGLGHTSTCTYRPENGSDVTNV